MKTLLIMRHAKSSWSNPGLADHERPLNERGRRDAPRIGEALREFDLAPELIIASTAARAVQTARLMAEGALLEGEIRLAPDFYHAGVDEYVEGLQGISTDEDIVMIVGHNPGIAELVDYLTDRPEMMTTANVAVVQLDIDLWEEMGYETEAELVRVLRPKEI